MLLCIDDVDDAEAEWGVRDGVKEDEFFWYLK